MRWMGQSDIYLSTSAKWRSNRQRDGLNDYERRCECNRWAGATDLAVLRKPVHRRQPRYFYPRDLHASTRAANASGLLLTSIRRLVNGILEPLTAVHATSYSLITSAQM